MKREESQIPIKTNKGKRMSFISDAYHLISIGHHIIPKFTSVGQEESGILRNILDFDFLYILPDWDGKVEGAAFP
jgi:hypothetical protein